MALDRGARESALRLANPALRGEQAVGRTLTSIPAARRPEVALNLPLDSLWSVGVTALRESKSI